VELRHYVTASGVDSFQDWLDGLEDPKGWTAILRRLDRLSRGNLGDRKFIADCVWELRIDVGPGYRVYFGQQGNIILLLLCGGSKGTQAADIRRATRFWLDYQRRNG
jgi:putative addiction module killer protein